MNRRNYQKELEQIIREGEASGVIPKLLLHACCAPCSSWCLEYLAPYFDITVFYYNPNIDLEEEYRKRVREEQRLISEMPLARPVRFLEGPYEPEEYHRLVKGHEKDPEGGERCGICFRQRLQKTAETAAQLGYDCFTTTLTISPLKNADRLAGSLEKLAHAVSRTGKPLIIAESYDMGDVLPQVKKYAGEAETVRHIHPDVWTAPDLEKYVNALGCRKVVIAGAATNVEILQTAESFIRRGIKVVILEDCCDSPDRRGHELSLKMMEEMGCCISTLGTEVMKLTASCSKQVLDAVKNILFT